MTAAMPPPAPPPAITEESSSSAPPTFLELWREKEKRKAPALTSARFAEYFDKQLLFPRHIPETALCDVAPILALIARHGDVAADGDDVAGADAALDRVRDIAARCATYKDKAVLNRNEFRHKRSVEIREQRRQQEDDEVGAGAAFDAQAAAALAEVEPPPPYHPEFTPLPVPGNYLLTKIHSANYGICVAQAACPHRARRLLACWQGADPAWVAAMERHGTEGRVCAEEREGVERCLGRSVQRVMKSVLG